MSREQGVRAVAVFCSSSSRVSPMYMSEMDLLARELVQNKIRIVYGGSRTGLMGRLADTALSLGGEVVGVLPQYLNNPETVHPGLTELIVVDDLLDRKRKMLAMADAAVASPGGMGTLDEITEVIALRQLGEHYKPIVFHNFLDFWRPFLDFIEELRLRSMVHDEVLYSVEDSAAKVVSFLTQPRQPQAAL